LFSITKGAGLLGKAWARERERERERGREGAVSSELAMVMKN